MNYTITNAWPPEPALAKLALALVTIDPHPGKRPDIAEIIAWAEGQLPTERAAEVEAFVARDEECYEIWSDYTYFREELKDSPVDEPLVSIMQVSPKQSWWKILWKRINTFTTLDPPFPIPDPLWIGGLMTSAIAVLLVVKMIPQISGDPMADMLNREYQYWEQDGQRKSFTANGSQFLAASKMGLQHNKTLHSSGATSSLSTPEWYWPFGFTKSIIDPLTNPESSAFLAGAATSIPKIGNWNAQLLMALNQLPPQPAPCKVTAGNECVATQTALQHLGSWALLLQSACAIKNPNQESNANFWSRQNEVRNEMRTTFGKLACTSNYCQRVQKLIMANEVTQGGTAAYCELSTKLFELTITL